MSSVHNIDDLGELNTALATYLDNVTLCKQCGRVISDQVEMDIFGVKQACPTALATTCPTCGDTLCSTCQRRANRQRAEGCKEVRGCECSEDSLANWTWKVDYA